MGIEELIRSGRGPSLELEALQPIESPGETTILRGGEPKNEIAELLAQIKPLLQEIYKSSPEVGQLAEERKELGRPDFTEWLKGQGIIALLSMLGGSQGRERMGETMMLANQGYYGGLPYRTAPEREAWEMRAGNAMRGEQATQNILASILTQALQGQIQSKYAQPEPEKWGDWGYGQKRNLRTGEVATIPTKPEKPQRLPKNTKLYRHAKTGDLKYVDVNNEREINKVREAGYRPFEKGEGALPKVGQTREIILWKVAQDQGLSEGEHRAWEMMSEWDREVGFKAIQLAQKDMRWLMYQNDPKKQAEIIGEYMKMLETHSRMPAIPKQSATQGETPGGFKWQGGRLLKIPKSE